MGLKSVDLYQQPAARHRLILDHAIRLVHGGRTAQLDERVWAYVREGQDPPANLATGLGPPASEAEAAPDPIKDQPCCE